MAQLGGSELMELAPIPLNVPMCTMSDAPSVPIETLIEGMVMLLSRMEANDPAKTMALFTDVATAAGSVPAWSTPNVMYDGRLVPAFWI
jgi:hypothetical protein